MILLSKLKALFSWSLCIRSSTIDLWLLTMEGEPVGVTQLPHRLNSPFANVLLEFGWYQNVLNLLLAFLADFTWWDWFMQWLYLALWMFIFKLLRGAWRDPLPDFIRLWLIIVLKGFLTVFVFFGEENLIWDVLWFSNI